MVTKKLLEKTSHLISSSARPFCPEALPHQKGHLEDGPDIHSPEVEEFFTPREKAPASEELLSQSQKSKRLFASHQISYVCLQ